MSKTSSISTLTREELIDEVTQLKHQVALLQKLVFGPRSDRFKVAAEVVDNQLSLGVSTESLAEVEVEKTIIREHDRTKVKLQTKKHPGRNPLPSSLRGKKSSLSPPKK